MSSHLSELSWRLLRKRQTPSCRCLIEVPVADADFVSASTSASHRGAAANLLHQSPISWRLRRKGQTPSCRCLVEVPAADTSTPLVSPPPPRIEEQPQACSICQSSHGGYVAKGNHHHADDWSKCRRQTRARTLHQPPPRTEEQLQASISRSFHHGGYMYIAKGKHHHAGAWLKCRRQTRALR